MEVLEIVKARFHEAADTEKYLSRPRVGNGAGFWPLHQYTEEDMKGWDKKAEADNADRWARNRKLTREAIARHEECLTWTILFLPSEQHRHIVWRWAFCQAYGWSFSESCRRRGWVKMTAYRRLHASFARIADELLGTNTLPREPDDRFLLQDEPLSNKRFVGLAIAVDVPAAIKFSPGYQTEKSSDLIKTQDDMDTFAKFLERRNARLRKLNAWRDEKVAS